MGATYSNPESFRMPDDGFPTPSSQVQRETEDECVKFFRPLEEYSDEIVNDLVDVGFVDELTKQPKLLRRPTIEYLNAALGQLSSNYSGFDAIRPWVFYWTIHSLELLDANPVNKHAAIINTLSRLQHPQGGFAGGISQFAHTAPCYAAVLALITLGTKEAYDVIDRKGMYKFFMRIKVGGKFMVQDDGEMDTRGVYTVLAVASLLNMLTPELVEGCAEFVSQCQTFEGGIGGEPGNEAHGGYAFCGLAALVILDRVDALDLDLFIHWLTTKQMSLEGGFQGRANKLVDGCYSFWQVAVGVMLQNIAGYVPTHAEIGETGCLLFDQIRLQQYTLLCCQNPKGGLRDKPSKPRDHYHTCYNLSGLSLTQHNGNIPNTQTDAFDTHDAPLMPTVWGHPSNLVKATDPVYNVSVEKLNAAREYFGQCVEVTHEQLMS